MAIIGDLSNYSGEALSEDLDTLLEIVENIYYSNIHTVITEKQLPGEECLPYLEEAVKLFCGLNIVEGQDFLYIPFPFMNVQGNCTDNRMGNRGRGQAHSTDSPKKKKKTTANVLAFSLYEGRQCGRTFPAWEKPRLNIINNQFQGLGLTGVEQQFEYPLWFSKFFNLPSFEDYFLCNLRVDSMRSRNNVKTFQLTSM